LWDEVLRIGRQTSKGDEGKENNFRGTNGSQEVLGAGKDYLGGRSEETFFNSRRIAKLSLWRSRRSGTLIPISGEAITWTFWIEQGKN
jgi:hypothetical protein